MEPLVPDGWRLSQMRGKRIGVPHTYMQRLSVCSVENRDTSGSCGVEHKSNVTSAFNYFFS